MNKLKPLSKLRMLLLVRSARNDEKAKFCSLTWLEKYYLAVALVRLQKIPEYSWDKLWEVKDRLVKTPDYSSHFLIEFYRTNDDPWMHRMVLEILADIPNRECAPLFHEVITKFITEPHESENILICAARGFEKLNDKSGLARLLDIIKFEHKREGQFVLPINENFDNSIAALGGSELPDKLLPFMWSNREVVRGLICRILTKIKWIPVKTIDGALYCIYAGHHEYLFRMPIMVVIEAMEKIQSLKFSTSGRGYTMPEGVFVSTEDIGEIVPFLHEMLICENKMVRRIACGVIEELLKTPANATDLESLAESLIEAAKVERLIIETYSNYWPTILYCLGELPSAVTKAYLLNVFNQKLTTLNELLQQDELTDESVIDNQFEELLPVFKAMHSHNDNDYAKPLLSFLELKNAKLIDNFYYDLCLNSARATVESFTIEDVEERGHNNPITDIFDPAAKEKIYNTGQQKNRESLDSHSLIRELGEGESSAYRQLTNLLKSKLETERKLLSITQLEYLAYSKEYKSTYTGEFYPDDRSSTYELVEYEDDVRIMRMFARRELARRKRKDKA